MDAKERFMPARTRRGTTTGKINETPKEAERKPVKVVPICTALKNRLGLCIILEILPDFLPICPICESLNVMRVISVQENTPPRI